MLVLTRKVGESIVIGDSITLTVTKIDGNQVRLGVSAPRNVAIDREEVRRRILEWAEPTAVLSAPAGREVTV